MTLTTFLKRILPAQGTYFTVQITNTGATRQFKHDDLAEAERSLEAITARHHNAYIATGAFGAKRTIEACKFKRVWYVDIDCKENGQYPDKKSAKMAIAKARAAGLPDPTLIVDSGNGFHLYWVCLEDVAAKDWKGYAKALVAACKRFSLNIDAGVSVDAARILRAPETVNYKDPKHPLPCAVKYDKGPDYTFAQIANAFNPFLTGPATIGTGTDHAGAAAIVDDLSGGLPEGMVARAEWMIPECAVFKTALEDHGANDSEPLWHKIIHTLAFCEDGEEYLHTLSDGHPTYDEGETNRKFAFSLKKKTTSGPTLCDTFSTLSTECSTCPHHGKIKVPTVLGFSAPIPPGEPPFPWRNGDRHLEKQSEDGWEPVVRYKVREFEAVVDPGEDTHITIKIGSANIKSTLSMMVTDNRSLQGVLAKYGVTLDTHELEELKRLMNAWMQQLRESNQVTQGLRKLGWVDKGFHYAGRLYTDSGSTETKATDHLFGYYQPKGKIDPWRECANHILSQQRQAAWCVIASAFGAPLINFTDIGGGTMLSIVSQDTGTGKSTALRVAQAVWGDPKQGMANLNDTANAIANRMGMLNTLPVYWDEVREKKEVQQFVNHIFRLVQGKEKARLNSSIQQREAGEWSTILTIASNDPLKDHLLQTVGNSDAGTARVLELRAEVINDPTMKNDAEARNFYGRIKNNFGNAGLIYAQWLANNPELAEATLQKVDQKISARLNSDTPERFWVATAASLVAGAQIATKLKLCNFDIPALYDYLIKQIKVSKRQAREEWSNPTERSITMVMRYMHEKRDYLIHAESMPRPGNAKNAILPHEFRNPAVGRIGHQDGVIRLLLEDFSDWYYEKDGAGATHIIENLLAVGAKKGRYGIYSGTPYSGPGDRHPIIDIPTTNKAFKQLLGFTADNTPDNSDLGA